ncbi:MAG: hypothetical protein ACREWG_09705 [Gammaproteobacteria bacterium]
MKQVIVECCWEKLRAELLRDPDTGMYIASLTAPVAGGHHQLLAAYGTNNAVLAFNAITRFERQVLLGRAARAATLPQAIDRAA